MPRQKISYSGKAALAALLLVTAGLTACTQAPRAEDVTLPGETPTNKNDPYPDFSKPLSSAMEQMSDEDARKMQAQLSGLAARRQSGAISEAEYRRRVKEMQALSESMKSGDSSN